MLARLVKQPFSDPNWLFETKWDGYRAIAVIDHGKVDLYSRKGNSFNERYRPIVEALASIDAQAVLDGEVVATDEDGRATFQLLQNYQRTGEGNLQYYVFDILELNGERVTDRPLVERKKLLRALLPGHARVKFSEYVIGKGELFLKKAERKRWEGIMAKRMQSKYLPGMRSDDWQKIKAVMRQEAVIGGFTDPKGSRQHLGALILGVYDDDDLVYVGHAGGGFNKMSLQEMRETLEPLVQEDSPFSEPPKKKSDTPVHWVEPRLVCEVAFSEWTSDGIFRQPIFMGLREDKDPREVVRETGQEGGAAQATPERKVETWKAPARVRRVRARQKRKVPLKGARGAHPKRQQTTRTREERRARVKARGKTARQKTRKTSARARK